MNGPHKYDVDTLSFQNAIWFHIPLKIKTRKSELFAYVAVKVKYREGAVITIIVYSTQPLSWTQLFFLSWLLYVPRAKPWIPWLVVCSLLALLLWGVWRNHLSLVIYHLAREKGHVAKIACTGSQTLRKHFVDIGCSVPGLHPLLSHLLFPLCQHCARFWSKVDSLIWWKKLISNKLGLNDCREAHCAVWGALGLYKGMACVDSPCHSRKICQRRQLSAESLNWKRGLLSGKGIVLCAEGIALLKGSGRKKHGMFWGLERDLVCLWDWMAGNELVDKAWA